MPQKKGLALGAIFALLTTLFGALPAQAAAVDGANIAIRPVAGTTFAGMVYNEFDLYAEALPDESDITSLKWRINVTSGHNMSIVYHSSGSAVTVIDEDTTVATKESSDVITASDLATSNSFAATVSSGISYLTIKASSTSTEATSWSSVTMTIIAWVDSVLIGDGVTSGTGVIDADEWRTTKTLTLYNMTDLPVTNNWTTPAAFDTYVTASTTITGVNFNNLGAGKFFLAASSSQSLFTNSPTVTSGLSQQTSASAIANSSLTARSGVLTASWVVPAISESKTVSFQLRYAKNGTAGVYTAGFGKTATDYLVATPGVTSLAISSAEGANVIGSGAAYTVRPNQTYTVKVLAKTNSVSVSKAVTVTLGGTGLVTSSKLLSINGGAFLTTYPAAGFTVTTGADGYGTFTMATSGFVENDTLTVDASVAGVDATRVTYTVANPDWAVVADDSLVATAPGTAVNLGVSVVDQWTQSSAVSNHYLKVTRGGTGFNYSSTVSYQAISGVGTVVFTPQGATATGSATVTIDVVKLENGAYIVDGTSDSVTVTVTSNTNAFGTGLARSFSASVSYFPDTVSWTAVTGYVAVTGSSVVVTADSGLIFRKSAAVPATTSGTITVASGSDAQYSFEVASLHSGDKTMTLTNGSAVTTSLLVVANAASDNGATMTWDTTAITAGKTKVIIGTLVDANGNPVDTTAVGSTVGDSGTASILVTYTGTAGIVVGSMPTETDADGKFRLSVLTSAADSGTMTITATYLPQGSSTRAQDKVSSVNTVTVGSTVAASDQKVNAGSFKGYVAVYAKGYAGQRMSAKIGNDWVVVESLASNFERVTDFTGAGYTIAVRIYIDRVLVDTITVTTK